ncbi:MFS transporter [Arsenicicoccus dermatophilus]|uniref:MFS transporter n=1 Tax=Arsenicicoccus dermatophilus TaxID=1076331 RepID=UPI00391703DF
MTATDPTPEPGGGTSRAAFARYWAGAAISSAGTAVTAVAMPVLVVQHLAASPTEVGLVNAAQLVPYAALGLVAGAYVDRWPRKPVLVWSSVGRAVSLAAIPALGLTGLLDAWMLVVALLALGSFSVFGFAATQSLLPLLVPRGQLVTANARLDQTDSAAQTLGPAAGGALVAAIGAPLAVALDAVSYAVEALLVAGMEVVEPARHDTRRRLHEEVREGLSWTYRHPSLGPLALSTHTWFLANGIAMTTLALLVLRTMSFSPAAYGALLTCSGLAGLAGTFAAARLGRRHGSGPVVVAARAAYPLAWGLVAASTLVPHADVVVFVALAILGAAMGVSNANEMGLWQSQTPDVLMGRVNGARRSVNRTLAAAGSAAAGILITLTGVHLTLVVAVIGFGIAAWLTARGIARSTEDVAAGTGR